MKISFFHDGPLRVDSQNKYYGIAHNNDMFQRYFALGNEITAVIRTEIIEDEEMSKYSEISLPNFKVISTPPVSNIRNLLLNWKKRMNILECGVLNSDIIIARIPSQNGFKAIEFAKKYNKPYIVELVTCPWDMYMNHGSIIGKIIAPISYLKTKAQVRDAKNIIYVTESFLQKRYPSSGFQINCSNVIIKQIEDDILEKRISKINRMDIKKDTITIGTIGSLNVKFKGQKFVIKALKQLKDAGMVNFKYQLVGSGSSKRLKKYAEKLGVQDQVHFIGPLNHMDVMSWYETIDIYIQPSKQEGLPRSVIEAMSKALPVIGSNVAGIPELINKNDSVVTSNVLKMSEEIADILININTDFLLNKSVENFKESKKYLNSILEKRRTDFFKEILFNQKVRLNAEK